MGNCPDSRGACTGGELIVPEEEVLTWGPVWQDYIRSVGTNGIHLASQICGKAQTLWEW